MDRNAQTGAAFTMMAHAMVAAAEGNRDAAWRIASAAASAVPRETMQLPPDRQSIGSAMKQLATAMREDAERQTREEERKTA